MLVSSPTCFFNHKPQLQIEEREGYETILIAKAMHHECCISQNTPACCDAFISVIKNRVELGKRNGYGDTVYQVLTQPGQFSGFKSWVNPCSRCLKYVKRFKILYKGITHYTSQYDYKGYENKIKILFIAGNHKYGFWKK